MLVCVCLLYGSSVGVCVYPLDPSVGGPSVGMCLTCECCVGVSGCHMYSMLVCVCLIIRCSVGMCLPYGSKVDVYVYPVVLCWCVFLLCV